MRNLTTYNKELANQKVAAEKQLGDLKNDLELLE